MENSGTGVVYKYSKSKEKDKDGGYHFSLVKVNFQNT